MATLLSPGIAVTQNDLSLVVSAEGNSAAVFAGNFQKGPVGSHVLISSVTELRENFGMPTNENYNDYYQVQNFLAYSGAIYVSRAADINGTPTLYKGLTYNDNAYVTNAIATKIENANLLEVDSVDLKFDKTDAFEIGQVLKFNNSNKEYKVKYIRTEIEQIPNPEYKPLVSLMVDIVKNINVQNVSRFEINTNGDDFEIQNLNADIILVNKSNKTITGLKEGTATLKFIAYKENYRQNEVEVTINVTAQAITNLIVTPSNIELKIGEEQVLNIDTEDENYNIISNNLAVARIKDDRQTIEAVGLGRTEITLNATVDGKLTNSKNIVVVVVENTSSSETLTSETLTSETLTSESSNVESLSTGTETSSSSNVSAETNGETNGELSGNANTETSSGENLGENLSETSSTEASSSETSDTEASNVEPANTEASSSQDNEVSTQNETEVEQTTESTSDETSQTATSAESTENVETTASAESTANAETNVESNN